MLVCAAGTVTTILLLQVWHQAEADSFQSVSDCFEVSRQERQQDEVKCQNDWALAHLDSMRQMASLADVLAAPNFPDPPFYVGAKRMDGVYTWTSKGVPVDADLWAEGAPQSSDCVVLDTSASRPWLLDKTCSEKRHYLCRKTGDGCDSDAADATTLRQNARMTTLETTTSQPAPETTTLETTTSQPAPETTTLETTTSQPAPETTTLETTTSQPAPETTTLETTTSQPAPETTTLETTTPRPDPETTTLETTTLQPDPETTTLETTTLQPDPETTTLETTTLQPDPETTTLETTTLQPDPETTTLETTTLQPDPETTTLETTTLQPDPETITLETTTLQPDPETSTSETTTQRPDPETTTSQTTTPKPDPHTTQAVKSGTSSFTPDSETASQMVTLQREHQTNPMSVDSQTTTAPLTTASQTTTTTTTTTIATQFESLLTSEKMTPSETSPHSTSLPTVTTTPTPCACQCQAVKNNVSVTESELADRTEAIKSELTMNTQNLSATVRKKTSAADQRMSARVTGAVGVVFLVFAFSLLVAMDLHRVFASLTSAQSKSGPRYDSGVTSDKMAGVTSGTEQIEMVRIS